MPPVKHYSRSPLNHCKKTLDKSSRLVYANYKADTAANRLPESQFVPS